MSYGRFETRMKQFDKSFCLLPKETGPCKAYFENFYYDPEKRICQKFVYGGCHGKLLIIYLNNH